MAGGYEHGYEPPEWWMHALLESMGLLPDQEKTWNRSELAARASEYAGRKPGWDSTRITKLLKGENVTLELVQALSMVIGIPCPFYEARTRREAEEMTLVRRRYDVGTDTAKLSKLSQVAQHIDAAVKSRTDQTDAVPSEDERSPRDPRTRRASSRR